MTDCRTLCRCDRLRKKNLQRRRSNSLVLLLPSSRLFSTSMVRSRTRNHKRLAKNRAYADFYQNLLGTTRCFFHLHLPIHEHDLQQRLRQWRSVTQSQYQSLLSAVDAHLMPRDVVRLVGDYLGLFAQLPTVDDVWRTYLVAADKIHVPLQPPSRREKPNRYMPLFDWLESLNLLPLLKLYQRWCACTLCQSAMTLTTTYYHSAALVDATAIVHSGDCILMLTFIVYCVLQPSTLRDICDALVV